MTGGTALPTLRKNPYNRAMRALSLLGFLLLTACGALPQPMFGNPGAQGALLAQPPPSRLAVHYPAQSLLPDAAATLWAQAVASALVEQEIPADPRPPTPGRPPTNEWSLDLVADIRGNAVVPAYTINNPAGQSQGVTEGAPIPTATWANGNPDTLKAAAEQAAPGIATMLNRIEAARRQSDPNSLLNRPTRVYLSGVTGAPGDGGRSLPTQMRIKLESAGLVVQDAAKGADFEVHGEIQTARGANNTIRVELQWIVSDAHSERGRILQINEVDPRAINPYWGDTAVAVATEAANGVKDVIGNATGLRKPPVAPPAS